MVGKTLAFSMSTWLYIASDKREVSQSTLMARIHVLLLSLFLVFSLVAFTLADHDNDNDDDENSCVYMIYVQTGLMQVSGSGYVSLNLTNVYDETLQIDNLEKWGGQMGPDHECFQSENLDIFTGRGNCLVVPPCAMTLTWNPTSIITRWWLCEFVQVTSTEANSRCAKQQFHVAQYLIPGVGPIEGSGTITRNYCVPGSAGDSGRVKPGRDASSYVA